MIPGEVIPADGTIELSAGAARVELEVHNTGDRPVQVGSHFHFPQANAALEFDRAAAHGLPAGRAGRHRGPVRAGHPADRDAGRRWAAPGSYRG